MKKYNITVNGNTYEVEVEEVEREKNINIGNNLISQPTPLTPKLAPKVKIKENFKNEIPQEKQIPPVGVETINAPMPGSIFEVKVSVGDTVAEGDTLLILEAMKMENEIMAPRDGRIAQVNTSKGQTVETGDPLISLE